MCGEVARLREPEKEEVGTNERVPQLSPALAHLPAHRYTPAWPTPVILLVEPEACATLLWGAQI